MCLYTLNIRAVAGVYLYFFALVNKQRNHYGCSCFKGCWLLRVGSSVTGNSRLAVSNFKYYVLWQFAAQYLAGFLMHYYFANIAFLQKVVILNALAVDGNLVKSFLVHKVVTHIVFIQELVRAANYAGSNNIVTCRESML